MENLHCICHMNSHGNVSKTIVLPKDNFHLTRTPKDVQHEKVQHIDLFILLVPFISQEVQRMFHSKTNQNNCLIGNPNS